MLLYQDLSLQWLLLLGRVSFGLPYATASYDVSDRIAILWFIVTRWMLTMHHLINPCQPAAAMLMSCQLIGACTSMPCRLLWLSDAALRAPSVRQFHVTSDRWLIGEAALADCCCQERCVVRAIYVSVVLGDRRQMAERRAWFGDWGSDTVYGFLYIKMYNQTGDGK